MRHFLFLFIFIGILFFVSEVYAKNFEHFLLQTDSNPIFRDSRYGVKGNRNVEDKRGGGAGFMVHTEMSEVGRVLLKRRVGVGW